MRGSQICLCRFDRKIPKERNHQLVHVTIGERISLKLFLYSDNCDDEMLIGAGYDLVFSVQNCRAAISRKN
jgi:hypothetical protein